MSARDLKESKLESETIFEGRLLHVLRDRVRLPNGKESTREYILHPGAVIIIPVLRDDVLVMEKQYRYAPDAVFYELPAGKVDPGEDYQNTAERELLEETGYRAGRLDFLCHIHPAIGYADERMGLYLARDLEYVGHSLDEDEFLEIVEVTLDEALEMVRQDKITDAKTMVGLFWAEKVLRGNWGPDER